MEIFLLMQMKSFKWILHIVMMSIRSFFSFLIPLKHTQAAEYMPPAVNVYKASVFSMFDICYVLFFN